MTANEAPYPEPGGYRAEPGYVKSDPRNNDYYVEQWRGDPWYKIISATHEYIEEICPGYNIDQIKEKFGGLRYYVSRGHCDPTIWLENLSFVQRKIGYAEGVVAGMKGYWNVEEH